MLAPGSEDVVRNDGDGPDDGDADTAVLTSSPEADFCRLVRGTTPGLMRFLGRRGRQGAAEDLLADVFLAAWTKWPSLPDDDDGRRAWLYGAARIALLRSTQGEQRRARLVHKLVATSTVPPTEEAGDTLFAEESVAAMLALLPPGQAAAVRLIDVECQTVPEAAAALGTTPTNIRSALSRGRRTLRATLLGSGEGGRDVTP